MKNQTQDEKRSEKQARVHAEPEQMTLGDRLIADKTLVKPEPPAPVEVGQILELECFEDAKTAGCGVAKNNQGFIVIIKDASKGWKGKAKITRVYPRYAWAEAVWA